MSDELLEVFATEGRELVERAAEDLAAVRRNPRDTGALEGLFRAVHTLKGSAGLVDFADMGALFHAAEDRLEEVRAGRSALTPALLSGLADALDFAEGWIAEVERAGTLPPSSGAWRAVAAAMAGRGGAPAEPEQDDAASAGLPGWAAALVAESGFGEAGAAFRYQPSADAYFLGEDPLARVRSIPAVAFLKIEAREPHGDLSRYDPFTCNMVLSGISASPAAEVRAALRLLLDQAEAAPLPGAAATPATASGESAKTRTLRIQAEQVDGLVAAADELVVLKNALSHLQQQALGQLDTVLARRLTEAQAAVDRQVMRMHGDVMRLRMTPLGPLLKRFPRLAREAAAGSGKAVEVVIEGGDIEVDKSVADGLFEPLLHLVRNAVDHGLETTEARRAAGKPAAGRIRLAARAAGDEVLIEVEDDGAGVDLRRVRAVAVDRGLIEETAAEELSDEDALDLVFAAGFSTAAKVSRLSGRGVGMDAVRHVLEGLGGSVRLDSEPGRGSTAILSVPARVRLARLMVVEAAGEAYALPLEAVMETARVSPAALTSVRAGRAFVWRDQAVPVLALSALVGEPPEPDGPGDLKIVLVDVAGEPAALSVDRFGERIEAPVRPLAGLLRRLPGLVGTTLGGDGRVLMVLDPAELVG